MATLGSLEYLISVNTSGMEQKLAQTDSKVKGYGEKLSAWTIAKGHMIARFGERMITSTVGQMKNMVAGAVNSYKEYEQLEGGIRKIFEENADTVIKNARQAYMTAGVSANNYMQTVMDFAASLKDSLGGDTEKAAEVANKALIDMSDNANMFGSSMESIQNAYRGFAKQNYTMLDNLKLGYGGTKTEMERLLKDAEAYQKTQGKTVEYSIKNLADVYEAIGVIQQKQNVAGTTEKEALDTIEGSMNAAKAAWENVLTSIGSGKGVKQAIYDFGKTAKTALKNLQPVVLDSVKGVVLAAKELFPVVVDTAKDVVNYLGRSIFGKDWDITINWIQNAWKDVNDAFNTAKEWVNKTAKTTVLWVVQAWADVTAAFNTAKEWVGQTFETAITWVQNKWDGISGAFDEASKWINQAFTTTFNFAVGLIENVRKAIAEISKPITVIVNFLTGKKTVADVTTDESGAKVTTYTDGSNAWDSEGGTGGGRGFAKGNWTVPYDNFPSLLHRGEMVLTKSQARQFRDGSASENIGGNIGREIREAMGKINVLLSGEKVGDLTTKRVRHNINASSYSRLRAMGG